MDRDVNRLTAATSLVMIIVLFIITCVSVEPYYLVQQEHVLYAESGTVTAFDHPTLQPTVSKYEGAGPMKIAVGEWLRVSPSSFNDSTIGWSYPGTGQQARYVCNLSWTAGYSVYVVGIDVFDGNAPWKTGSLTLIDAPGQANGRRNVLHMPKTIRPDGTINTVTG